MVNQDNVCSLTDYQLFEVSSITGVISLQQPIPNEATAVYTYQIQVTDTAGQATSYTIIFNVNSMHFMFLVL